MSKEKLKTLDLPKVKMKLSNDEVFADFFYGEVIGLAPNGKVVYITESGDVKTCKYCREL